MRLHRRIAAGTALALLMGTAQLAAAPTQARIGHGALPAAAQQPLILAQAQECPADNPDCAEEEAPAEAPAAPAEEPAAEQPAPEAPAEEPAPEAPAAEEPAAEAPAEEAPAAAEPAAEEPAAAEEAPASAEEAPADAEEAPAEEAEEPAPAAPAAEEAPAEQPAPAAPATEQSAPAAPAAEPAPEAPAAEQPAPAAPAAEQPAPAAPAAEQPAPAAEQPAPAAPAAEQPAPGATPPAAEPGAQPPAQTEGAAPAAPQEGTDQAAPQSENAAPVLDSQKEQAQPAGEGQPAQPTQQAQPAEPAAPPPTSDAEAQDQSDPQEIEPLTAERGERIDEDRVRDRRERRQGGDVLREIGERVVIQFGPQIIVESNDRERLRGNARDVYYEELPRGRTREVIVRENGTQVVTIRDRYGDIIRRSRITPDGREYVLVYADRRGDREGRQEFYDPGRDLPPLRLTIPVNEYILDAGRVEDPDIYYDFLDQPPVERIQRTYSIDEVKYSARVRDTVRRIDLDTVTFEFGSAAISESEVPRLEGVAGAMERLLEDNPAETFLIEGHTDAVGSDIANLALSDQRAESVAAALSNVFGIPPENLVTQGYGETYLKINTEEAERENRRVAIRRITPLVAPVASAN